MVKHDWYYCDHCGKKAFPVRKDTEVKQLPFKCRNSHCPRREQIITIKLNTESR